MCIAHTKQQELSQNKTNLYTISQSQSAQVSSCDTASFSEKQLVTGIDKLPTTIRSALPEKLITDGKFDVYTRFPLVLSVQLFSEISAALVYHFVMCYYCSIVGFR